MKIDQAAIHDAANTIESAIAKIEQLEERHVTDQKCIKGALANVARLEARCNSHDALVKALEYVSQLQDDKIEHADPETIFTLLRMKVDAARAALQAAKGES